jgi:hypothetical protein
MSALLKTAKIRESITKTTRLLVRDKVEVRQRGVQPLVAYNKDGSVKFINLPVIPDSPSPEFMDAMQGFLDHEAAHVFFTNINELQKSNDKAKAAKPTGAVTA